VPRMTKSADHKMMSSLSLAVRRTCHPLESCSLGAASLEIYQTHASRSRGSRPSGHMGTTRQAISCLLAVPSADC